MPSTSRTRSSSLLTCSSTLNTAGRVATGPAATGRQRRMPDVSTPCRNLHERQSE
jgi:hypothetical protein